MYPDGLTCCFNLYIVEVSLLAKSDTSKLEMEPHPIPAPIAFRGINRSREDEINDSSRRKYREEMDFQVRQNRRDYDKRRYEKEKSETAERLGVAQRLINQFLSSLLLQEAESVQSYSDAYKVDLANFNSKIKTIAN